LRLSFCEIKNHELFFGDFFWQSTFQKKAIRLHQQNIQDPDQTLRKLPNRIFGKQDIAPKESLRSVKNKNATG
jgi:hypothetical protein